jgi:hypothetical protein
MVLIEKKNNFLFWGVKGVVSTEEPKISWNEKTHYPKNVNVYLSCVVILVNKEWKLIVACGKHITRWSQS